MEKKNQTFSLLRSSLFPPLAGFGICLVFVYKRWEKTNLTEKVNGVSVDYQAASATEGIQFFIFASTP